ncbi:hypothetical protein TorRG33x02_320570 [Trema orientale]|uniref:Uncharacterized protein n=1 Tax=Trema orientale TaxID=63057 RepID=A0A2P5BHZ7_TREOI|nr:hypothetical protein TorRG33x02_320570 [Trema orientale]
MAAAAASPALANTTSETATAAVPSSTTTASSTSSPAVPVASAVNTVNRTDTPPKTLRGLNKPKCKQCGNVARSRIKSLTIAYLQDDTGKDVELYISRTRSSGSNFITTLLSLRR